MEEYKLAGRKKNTKASANFKLNATKEMRIAMKKELEQDQQETLPEEKGPTVVMSIKGWLKKAGRWIVKHVRVTKKSVSIKGKHDVGGGG